VLNGIVEAPSIGILISGGNVGADRFAELLTRDSRTCCATRARS